MVSFLSGSLARTLGRAIGPKLLDATLTRDVAGTSTDPADPVLPTTATYSCKAMEQEFSAGLRASGMVGVTDVEVLIMASTLSTDPQPKDRITIRGRTLGIVGGDSNGLKPVRSDPARATWLCRCRT